MKQWIYWKIKEDLSMKNTMKVKAIWEFEVDTEDFSEEFVDVKELAKDLTQREMENLLQNQEIEAEDFSYELEAEKQFTDDELYMLSDGILALIRSTNEALRLVCDSKSIEVLQESQKRYKDLNAKICGMLE